MSEPELTQDENVTVKKKSKLKQKLIIVGGVVALGVIGAANYYVTVKSNPKDPFLAFVNSTIGVEQPAPKSDAVIGVESGMTKVKAQERNEADLYYLKITESLDSISQQLFALDNRLTFIEEKMDSQHQADLSENKSLYTLLTTYNKSNNSVRDTRDQIVAAKLNETQASIDRLYDSIKDVSVGVKANKKAATTFPLTVYGKVVWGDEVYLNVASLEQPKNTFPLRVNETVQGWLLKEVNANEAIFFNSDNNKRVINL